MSRSEVEFRARVVRAGVRVTYATAAAALAYLLASPNGAHRPLQLALAGSAALDGLAISRLPRRWLIASQSADLRMALWNAAHIVMAVVLCLLDGGTTSPFMTIFFLSVAFAAVSLPKPAVVWLAALDVAGVLTVALAHGPGDIGASTILWS